MFLKGCELFGMYSRQSLAYDFSGSGTPRLLSKKVLNSHCVCSLLRNTKTINTIRYTMLNPVTAFHRSCVGLVIIPSGK